MSVAIQMPAAIAPVSAPRKPVAAGAVFAKAVDFVRAALMPSHAERQAKDVDIVSVSRWNGHGRNSVGWNDIGYRI